MNSLIRALVVLAAPLLTAACSVSSESRVCTYNNVVVSCDDFDQRSQSRPTPTQTSPVKSTNPSQVAACVTYAVRSVISRVDAERLCSKSSELGYCVADTVRAPISEIDSERLCSESSAFAQCVVDAIKGPISQVDAERICQK
jgi:hypothetical protein